MFKNENYQKLLFDNAAFFLLLQLLSVHLELVAHLLTDVKVTSADWKMYAVQSLLEWKKSFISRQYHCTCHQNYIAFR